MKKEKNLLVFFLTIISLIFSFLSIRNHEQFQTFAWDLGFFDQLIWKASRFLYPYSTIGKLTILGDHFQPVLYLLVPLYWLWSDVRIILIAQAFLVVFAAYPLYFLSRQVLKDKLAAWAVVFSFLFFTGTQFTITNEFHQSAFIPLFLNGLFLFSYQRKWRYYWLMVLGLLGTREELALLVAAIGIVLLFRRETRRVGLASFFVGITSFFFLVYKVIPYFNPRGVYPHFNYGQIGKTPVEVIFTIMQNPGLFLRNLVYPPIKIKTVLASFFSFAFLSLFSPTFLIPIGQQFTVRFIDSVTIHRWTNLNHYAIPLASLLAISSVFGICNLAKIIGFKKKTTVKILGLILFLFVCWQNLLFHGPINSIFKRQLYETRPWIKDNYQVFSKIPSGVSIAAQNSLVPHISHRNQIFLLPEINQAEYVWVDLADGPNKYAPQDRQKTEKLIADLLSEEEYVLFYKKGKSLLLKKR